jgi:catechol 2,3-dioxygenase-like lactoylglutathione lyase family enzyme
MRIVQTVLDTTDPRALAEFYRQLLGLSYRPGDEPPAEGRPDPRGEDWLVLGSAGSGQPQLAFQKTDELARSTWPAPKVPQQLHLDIAVETRAELDAAHAKALGLGAHVLLDRTDDPEEPLYVFADLAGHPFCIFVEPER